jgi:hypothetical protein
MIEAVTKVFPFGGELISASALKSGKANEITEAARQFVSIVRAARQQLR